MSIQLFPANPSDGMIYEETAGVFFVYEQASNSWMKVTGNEIFPLATPIRDGLMESADLRKINRVVVPAPNSTIKGEMCSTRFVAGYISLFGDDDFVTINSKQLLTNAGLTGGMYPFRITRNTAGIDFALDKNALFDALAANGRLNIRGAAGRAGVKGDKGPPGRTFATGPKGPKGLPGNSPTCTVSISQDTIPFETDPGLNKAVVALRTEQVGEGEFDLIVSLGVVGNPDAAPSLVNVDGEESTWLVAITTNGAIDQALYYIDVTAILNQIETKFKSEVERVRAGHESVVQSWLSEMSNLFSQQKAALCCALTLCEGQKIAEKEDDIDDAEEAANNRNQDLIDAIEDIQACNGDAGGSTEPVAVLGKLGGKSGAWQEPVPASVTTLRVDGVKNSGTIKNAGSITLPAGAYVVEVADCCIKSGQEYVGNVTIAYYNRGAQQLASFVKPGTFRTEAMAQRSYEHLGIEIEHDGGEIYAFLPSNLSQDLSGGVTIGFRTKEEPVPAPVEDGVETMAPPDALVCVVAAGRLAQYENAWETGECWGLVTRVGGQDYIVVRMLQDDSEFQCGQLALGQASGVALAWPTFDGKTFVKLTDRDQQPFKVDARLNDLVRANLQSNAFQAPRGDFSADPADPAMLGGVWSSRSHQMIIARFGVVLFPIL